MSRKPFIPWFFSDLVGDTLHLTTAQFGAYCLLLGAMWNANGYLPSDPEQLSRIARCDPRTWPRMWAALEGFFTVEGELITQGRLLRQMGRHADISTARAQAAGRRWAAAKMQHECGSLDPLKTPTRLQAKPLKSNTATRGFAHANAMQPYPLKIDDPKGSNLSSGQQQLPAPPTGRPDGPSGGAPDRKGDNVNRIEARAELVANQGEDFAKATFDRATFEEGPPMVLRPATTWAFDNLRMRAGDVLKKHGIKLERPAPVEAAAPARA